MIATIYSIRSKILTAACKIKKDKPEWVYSVISDEAWAIFELYIKKTRFGDYSQKDMEETMPACMVILQVALQDDAMSYSSEYPSCPYGVFANVALNSLETCIEAKLKAIGYKGTGVGGILH